MKLADLPGHPARAAARRHKVLVEAQFADMLTKAGAATPRESARAICLLLEGATSLILIHGDRRYADAAAKVAKKLLAKAA